MIMKLYCRSFSFLRSEEASSPDFGRYVPRPSVQDPVNRKSMGVTYWVQKPLENIYAGRLLPTWQKKLFQTMLFREKSPSRHSPCFCLFCTAPLRSLQRLLQHSFVLQKSLIERVIAKHVLFFPSWYTLSAQTSTIAMDFAITIGLTLLLIALYYYFQRHSTPTIKDANQPQRLQPQWPLGTVHIVACENELLMILTLQPETYRLCRLTCTRIREDTARCRALFENLR